jgi:hypothetical protein
VDQVKRALVTMLVAALVLPSVAGAQESSTPVNATPAVRPEPQYDIRLTFDGPRGADPWAVFGGSVAASANARPGGRIRALRADSLPAGPPQTASVKTAGLAQSRSAAKSLAAGQSPTSLEWWASRPGLLVLAVIAGVVVLLATGHGDEIPWLARR